jgi:Xaa-Pro aminopeptidase
LHFICRFDTANPAVQHPSRPEQGERVSKTTADRVDGISTKEYAQRRERVLKSLKGAAAVVFAGEGTPPLLGRWQAEHHFVYLTGIENESGGAVLFNPAAEDPKRRIVLFLRALNPELERWDGYRQPIGPELKAATGFETVMRANVLPMALTAAARRTRRLACLHPFAVYPASVSPDLAVFQEITKRIPGVAIEDQTNLLPSLRAIKSSAELRLMNRAVAATVAGYNAALGMIRPGITERDIADAMEFEYRRNGADSLAYNSIVGSGLNGTVLHYMDNNQPVRDGDLIVIDSGAACRGYAADITRTFPASGKFTADQREVYEVVLRAQLAATKAARPGVKMVDVDAAARNVIDRAGYGAAFIHNIGHQLGLQVHDVTPDGPLKPGMVVTIEPGVYLPERAIGVRIEDDILITARGNENLTGAVAKTVKDVEAAMARK